MQKIRISATKMMPVLIVTFVVAVIVLGTWILGLSLVKLWPWIKRFELGLLAVCIVSLPFAFFGKTMKFPLTVLPIGALAFAVGAWMLAFVGLYEIWGLAGALGGVLLGGVGVIPLAFLAALMHGDWALERAIAVAILIACLTLMSSKGLEARTRR